MQTHRIWFRCLSESSKPKLSSLDLNRCAAILFVVAFIHPLGTADATAAVDSLLIDG